ncbi:hypothetical protein [Rhodopila globiformis]|uniref:hypothetical protein n=1 Tax=Rhodopila globiformis TaxID=1071 RepID=UPI0011B0707B|nr:hypothetical protein [Rhodopila globiformis]
MNGKNPRGNVGRTGSAITGYCLRATGIIHAGDHRDPEPARHSKLNDQKSLLFKVLSIYQSTGIAVTDERQIPNVLLNSHHPGHRSAVPGPMAGDPKAGL